MKELFKNLTLVLGIVSIPVTLSLTSCDRPANTGGTADDSLNHARGTGIDLHLDTNSLDRAKDKIRGGLTNAAINVGRGLERAGQEIQGAASRNATNR